jgi:hypothetical protein
MRSRYLGWAGLLLLLALPPGAARAQPDATGYAPPVSQSPFPFYSTRPEEGFYFLGTYTMYRQTIPLEDQVIAVRGFIDADGSITGAEPGTQFGSLTPALDTGMVDGPQSYQPGFRIGGGWRFRDGSTFEASWMWLNPSRYTAVATLAAPFLRGGALLQDTFLSSPVYNFPIEFAGPDNDVISLIDGQPTSAFGIWNAADIMTLEYVQRFKYIDFKWRTPMYETECWRTYGLAGGRFAWFWENFKWRTTDASVDSGVDPDTVAIYQNIVSNRMYGPFVGLGNEWYMGNGLAVSLDLEAALLLDVVKKRASYERGDRKLGPKNKRQRVDYTLVPEVRGTFNLWWYPIEGVQLKVGYDVMAFFNTIAAEEPVSFNYGGLDPDYDHVHRILDGLEIGIAISF